MLLLTENDADVGSKNWKGFTMSTQEMSTESSSGEPLLTSRHTEGTENYCRKKTDLGEANSDLGEANYQK